MTPHDREKTFAEILAEEARVPRPSRVVRPGSFNEDREFFDPSGSLLTLVGRVTPTQAQASVVGGALVAFEGCGCGGGGGCDVRWIDAGAREILTTSKPRFVRGYGSPTWLDLWRGDGADVVFAHGDVEWGGALPGPERAPVNAR